MTTTTEERLALHIDSPSESFSLSPLPHSAIALAESKPNPSSFSFSKGAKVRSRAHIGRSMAASSRSTRTELDKEQDPFKDIDLPEKYTRTHWTFFYFLQLAAFLMITSALVGSLTVGILKRHLIWGMKLWRWLLLILLVFCGRLVSGWGVRILVFFVERNFVFRKRVLYFVYSLRKGVQNCLWLGLVLLAWNLLLDPKVEHSTRNSKTLTLVNKLLYCLLIGSVIWLLKLLLLKVVASSFHVNTYFDRIQKSVYVQIILETLSGPPLYTGELKNLPETAPQNSPKSVVLKKGDRKKNDESEPFSVKHLHILDRKNVSAWSMKRLVSLVRTRHILSLAQTIDETANQDRESEKTHIQSETEATAAAKYIFENVAQNENCDHIRKEHLKQFLNDEDITRVWPQFDGAEETGKIEKESLKNWVRNISIGRNPVRVLFRLAQNGYLLDRIISLNGLFEGACVSASPKGSPIKANGANQAHKCSNSSNANNNISV